MIEAFPVHGQLDCFSATRLSRICVPRSGFFSVTVFLLPPFSQSIYFGGISSAYYRMLRCERPTVVRIVRYPAPRQHPLDAGRDS